MSQQRKTPGRRLFAAVLALALGGCGSLLFTPPPQISYFTLTPTVPATTAAPANIGITALQTVRLPQYLQQKPIVTRSQTNEVRLARNQQWASPLGDNVTSVLVADLARQLGGDKVIAFPFSPALPVNQVVHVEIARFEADAEGRVELQAQWLIFGDGGRTFLASGSGHYVGAAGVDDYASIVGAMSALVGEMSRDIATQLVTTAATRVPPPRRLS